MKSLVLVGLGNDEDNHRSYFVIRKEDSFKESFNELLEKLKLGPPIPIEQSPISELENELDHYLNNEFDLDVIYTHDRIILILRAEPKNLERFKSLISAYSKMEG